MGVQADDLKLAEERFRELKARCEARAAAFYKLCSTKSKRDDRRTAFWDWHNSAVEFFGSFDKVVVLGSASGVDKDPAWFTEHGETAINLLDTIAKHYETARIKAGDLGLNDCPPTPSKTSFAATQRIAKKTNPTLANEARDRFVRAALPTHGFDTDETDKVTTPLLERRFFVIGCVLLAVAVGMAIWGFSLGTLSPDQRNILLWSLPLASGFGCWSFTGSMSAKMKGWQGFVVSATGGFGVWLLSNFLLFRQ